MRDDQAVFPGGRTGIILVADVLQWLRGCAQDESDDRLTMGVAGCMSSVNDVRVT